MTRLRALKDKSPREASQILSATALSMLPRPVSAENDDVGPNTREIRDSILREIRERLRLAPEDRSPEAQAKIYQVLSDLMKDAVLPLTDQRKMRARVGQNGDLRPELYEIRFAKSFTTAEQRGVRRSHVEAALRKPDDVQHLNNDIGMDSDEHAVSLYVKRNEVDHDFFVLLVFTIRKGDQQQVQDAWRVYPDDVELSLATSPLEVLTAFLRVYGLKIRIGRKSDRLFLYDTIEVKDPDPDATMLFELEGGDEEVMISTHYFLRVAQEGQIIEIAFAFAVNETVYAEALRSHGLQIKPLLSGVSRTTSQLIL